MTLKEKSLEYKMILNKKIGGLLLIFCLIEANYAMTAEPTAEQSKNSLPGATANSPENTSLQTYVKQETAEKQAQDDGGDQTWLNNLVSTVAEKGAQVISSDNQKQENLYRTNASVFDISGIMLRMTEKQVDEAMMKHGYQKNFEKYEIPNFIRWRYEEQCRNNGVVGYERTDACVIKLAQKNNYQYVEQREFNNFRTKENIHVFFTSNFTGNKAYRIVYHSEAANIKGNGAKADYLRNIKIYDFWKKINQKYGVPDNKEQVIWGLGENKPFLQAATGKLMLYDPMLLEFDYTRMSREDQRFMNTAVYTF